MPTILGATRAAGTWPAWSRGSATPSEPHLTRPSSATSRSTTVPSLIAYRKVSDEYTTYQLKLPEGETAGERVAQEIATLPDGRTVCVLNDGAVLPSNQPPQIAASIQVIANPTAAQLEAVRKHSPHDALVRRRITDRIRSRYTVEDELQLLRMAVGELMKLYSPTPAETAAVNSYVEFWAAAMDKGRQEQSKLGLGLEVVMPSKDESAEPIEV